MAFKPHMTFLEAYKLNVGDKIDHRNLNGQFLKATITDKARNGMIKIHYDNLPTQYDTECSYMNELYRFAEATSISRRPGHRLKSIKQGSFVDINISQQSVRWRKAEVVKLCSKSGQIQVQYLLDITGGITKPIKWKRWVHLDNINEVDSFGVHTSNKEINHLPISLETKRAYLNTPNELKESCAMEIIETVYGGMANIVSFLIKNGSTSELQKMQQIIKNENNEKQNELVSNAEMIYTNKWFKDEMSSLSDLSRNSVQHICGFLDREDIKSFKLTSYRNGIICLHEMTKCDVGISNINEIIDDKNGKYVDELGMIIRSNYKSHRYSANMNYLSLQEKLQEKYNIPLSKQLLLSQNQTACRFYDTQKNDKMASFKIRTLPTMKFLLFDKRNTIKFDERSNTPKIMDICNEKKQSIAFIKWFDIYFQEITPLQFVMGNREEMTIDRLTRYLENEFIATTSEQKQWHSKLMKYFKKMDNISPNYPKLIAYKEHKNKLTAFNNPIEVIPWWTICIFQLNTDHPVFAKKKFTSIKEKYDLLT